MAVLKCKMCGGDIELSSDKTFGTCEYCGCTTTLPKISDEQRAAAFNRGNHFRRIGEFDKALAVYERIVQEDDTDAEAHWCCALCRFGIEYVEDPATYEWLPTCHRASFDSFLEDMDYKAALEHSQGITHRQYLKDGAKIAEVQRGILATSSNAVPFDVFICYKETDANGERTRDSIMAQDIYYQLTEHGHRVFFSRITLEDVAGTQYEPYIFAALNSAKVMVVVGTSFENLNAVWVKNEWSRFIALIKKDRSKVILPCYKDMDPYDLPEQLSILQSYDMSKIGFIQDLIRGIEKIIVSAPAIIASDHQETSESKQALLDRGFMALEDKEWHNAEAFFEKALNIDAKCAQAYLGKLLRNEACANLREFETVRIAKINKAAPIRANAVVPNKERISAVVSSYAVNVYLPADEIIEAFSFSSSYESYGSNMETILQNEERFLRHDRTIARFLQFASPKEVAEFTETQTHILSKMSAILHTQLEKEEHTVSDIATAYERFLCETEERIRHRREAVDIQRQARYEEALDALACAIEPMDFESVAALFEKLQGYRDSADRAVACYNKINEIIHSKDRTINEVKTKVLSGDFTGVFPAISQYESYSFGNEVKTAIWDYLAVRKPIAAAGAYAAIIRKDGSVHVYGSGNIGPCSINCTGWGSIVGLAASKTHLVGLRKDGTVVSTIAQLSQKEKEQIESSIYQLMDKHLLTFLNQCDTSSWTEIVSIAAGDCHTVGLRANGTAVAVGCNHNGQCELSSWNHIVEVAAGKDFTVGLKADGTVIVTESKRKTPLSKRFRGIDAWRDIKHITACGNDIVAVTRNGNIMFASQDLFSTPNKNTTKWNTLKSASLGDNILVCLSSLGEAYIGRGANPMGTLAMSSYEFIVDAATGEDRAWLLRCDGKIFYLNLYSSVTKTYGAKLNNVLFCNAVQDHAKQLAEAWARRDDVQKQQLLNELEMLNKELREQTGFFAGGKRSRLQDKIRAIEKEIEKISLAHM